MDVVDCVTEALPGTSGEESAGTSYSIRITRQGKFRVWVKKALDFLKDQPDRPLVLYSAPADVSVSTIARLISVVEIIKREYLKAQDVSTGHVSGLHQYNQLQSEQQGNIPAEEGGDRRDTLHVALDGRSHVKQSFAPHMKITLSVTAIAHRSERRETHQAPMIRRMSKAAKARLRKRLRKQVDGV